MHTKTRIVASIGPASNDKQILHDMINSGMKVARLNFSHGSYKGKLDVLKTLRELQDETGKHIAVIGDLQGPKLRLGELPGEGIKIDNGKTVIFTTNAGKTDNTWFLVNYDAFAKDIRAGDRILIDDGTIKLEAIETNHKDVVKATVISGGTLHSKKGINLPDSKLSLPAITDKDKEDIMFAVENKIDWIALSFVRSSKDIKALRSYLDEFYGESRIIAKIEKPEAVEDIDAITDAADGIMVARGDLGVEVDFKKVPVMQRNIVRLCVQKAKPVIIATQMLDSMIHNFRPTRAEANDVATAVMDMADGLMLSGETAIGKYPVVSIESMQSIIEYTEKEGLVYNLNHPPEPDAKEFIPDSVCYNASKMAQQTNAKAIITFSYSGYTALRISSHRPEAPIYAFTSNKKLLKKLPLIWGINAFYFPVYNDIDKAIAHSIDVLKKEGAIKKGDRVVHVGSTPLTSKSHTNMIKLSEVN
jgi:pyruvate kinase